MSGTAIAFYILSGLVLTFGALTIFTRMIFRAAIYLLLSLIGVAGIYLLMEMDFIAALQLIIYVGGIVVLIIFSIFLTHRSGEKLPQQIRRRALVGGMLAIVAFLMVVVIFIEHPFTPSEVAPMAHDVRAIGRQLLDQKAHGYVYPFELVSILLLAALVGSITIAIKEKEKNS